MKITNLKKSYGENQVLSGFSCKFQENQINGIMAPSGRGKTTLLKIIMGLETFDDGEIVGIYDKKISVVFQEDRLVENLSVLTNIAMVSEKSKEEIHHAIAEIGLCGYQKEKVSTLSGGMKRRVAILRALLAEGEILLLDEPFKGLDDNTKGKVIQIVKKHIQNRTTILVTHIKKEGEDLGVGNWIEL